MLNSADLDMHLKNADFNGRENFEQFSPGKPKDAKKMLGGQINSGLKKKS